MLKIFFFNSFLDHAFPGQFGFQYPASKIMDGIINLHHFLMFFIVIILFFVFSLIFLIFQHFTFNNELNFKDFLKLKDINNVNISHGSILEIIWIIVPTLILLFVAIPSFSLLYSMEAYTDCYILLSVIGHQWYWSYECVIKTEYLPLEEMFSDSRIDFLNFKHLKFKFDSYIVETADLKTGELRLLETTNPIVLPVDVGVKVLVTADDVIHSWAIPALGVKIDALPGRLNQVFLKIDRCGHFYGQCSEICGVNHGFMPISIYAVELKDFFKYVDFVSNSMYYNMYLKHFYLRSHSPFHINFFNPEFIENAYEVIFFKLKVSQDIKFSLFSQIFFEIITASFNDIVKKY